MSDKVIEALRLIAAKSESVRHEAVKTIQAVNVNSPILQKRLNFVASNALSDPAANFTEAERAMIAALLDTEEGETRTVMIRVRLTPSERDELERMADEAGLSLSDYIRSKIF